MNVLHGISIGPILKLITLKKLLKIISKVTKDKFYQSALHLFEVKDALEKHLSKRTNELFDLEDKIILYDLTNTHFEGEKRSSQLARFGRSKEKRKDAKLVALALVVNVEGFIKYSSILEGNIADSKTLSAMVGMIVVGVRFIPFAGILNIHIFGEMDLPAAIA